ncbi:glycosyltransferase family 69 protein [Cantharellus anzutake]|uniref:glycosyltransferase family 69 protein n=1 Tax=Cantharellus anzutake TaxID=1750568 RepID=UPI0019073EA9|nr:glycosyltransferase family 69 protein [Cantharellus anzutake]KAF8332331.1 glycosyltransferase family 69 protein [Cantharellus anzutake]
MSIVISFRRRSWFRALYLLIGFFVLRWVFFSPESDTEITRHNVLERVTGGFDKVLDVQKYPWLQMRIGRDESPDMLSDFVDDSTKDFWNRFQLPFMDNPDTSHIDAQAVRSAIEDLLGLNGWVAAACPTLSRPFGQNKRDGAFEELSGPGHLYYIAIVVHSADHFLVDQMATIIQLARRLGTRNIFVSMLDYNSRDSTETLTDLAEAVMLLLSIPFRIRRVPPMTETEIAAYYPGEEAYARNLALEPLHELKAKRNIRFDKVIWLKGFTCPNDILENLKVSQENRAAMTCGMDWAESNGAFIFSDRWRTRDMVGDQFRASRSSAPSPPPREETAAERYAKHLPFQVFCCESGTHIVDPAQTYYRSIKYRYSKNFFNTTMEEDRGQAPDRRPEDECMDSTQAWFCRDIWVEAARAGMGVVDQPKKPPVLPVDEKNTPNNPPRRWIAPRDEAEPPQENEKEKPDNIREMPKGPLDMPPKPASGAKDADANVGSDYDAMPQNPNTPSLLESHEGPLNVPNSDFEPARVIINPRCVTTYAGVSHTKLAIDLFGSDDGGMEEYDRSNYLIEEWKAAPEYFICQEQQTTGGRKAPKNQRSSTFSIYERLAQ